MIRFPANWKTPAFLSKCPICGKSIGQIKTVRPKDVTRFSSHLYQAHDIPPTALP